MKTFKQQVEHQRKLAKKHNEKLYALLEQCPHEVLLEKSKYYESGYDYPAHTEYWDQCELCNKKINHETEDHGRFR